MRILVLKDRFAPEATLEGAPTQWRWKFYGYGHIFLDLCLSPRDAIACDLAAAWIRAATERSWRSGGAWLEVVSQPARPDPVLHSCRLSHSTPSATPIAIDGSETFFLPAAMSAVELVRPNSGLRTCSV